MLRDDALLAFERHATSKLSDVKDLLSIATLGFRGEALPSIASVSRLLLETRAAEETTGAAVEIAGGKMLRCDEFSRPAGTTITVRDLFYNVPARKKFLRSDQTELAHIASLATHYSLAHPKKSFQLRHGTSQLLDVTPVETLRERVYQVFGSQTLEELIDLDYVERELDVVEADDRTTRVFALRGFVSGPQVQKMNRNSIFLFVNGRLIRDRLLLHALSSAYHNLMPPACYPFALLFLDCDCEEVDVNVHPSKTEVRFRHGSFVHDFVRDCDSRTLDRLASGFEHSGFAAAAARRRFALFRFHAAHRESALRADAQRGRRRPERMEDLPVFTLHTTAAPEPRFDFESHCGRPQVSRYTRAASRRRRSAAEPGSALSDLRPLGQIHESFIIAAGRDGLWIIDQHVAHERILFEKVLRQQAEGRVERQQLLMPILLELTAAPADRICAHRRRTGALRLRFRAFGNRTIAVKGAPAGVGPAEIEKLVFRDSGNRRGRAAQSLVGRSAPRHGCEHRLPRGHQDQHAAGSTRWSGC